MGERRTYGTGGLTQRPDGRYEATAWIEDAEGRKRRHFYGWTAEEAQGKLDRARRVSASGGRAKEERVTVGAWLDEWLVYAEGRLRPNSVRYNAQNIRLYLKPRLGRIRLSRLTPRDVEGLMAWMTAQGLSPRTCAMAHATLRNALNHAQRLGMVERNVATLVKPPRDEPVEMQALTPDQVQRLFASTSGDRMAAAYVVAVMTGLRQGEMLALRWEDVDTKAATLTINGTLRRIPKSTDADGNDVPGSYVIEKTKTRRSQRTVQLSPLVTAALAEHRVRQAEERLAKGRKWHDWGLVFPSSDGYPQNGTALTHSLQAHCEQITKAMQEEARKARDPRWASLSFPVIRWHDLRHTAATLMLMSGAPMRVVMETLGHSTIVLTANLYSHVTPAMSKSTADAVETLVLAAR